MSKLQRKACPLKDDTLTSSDSGSEVISINDGEPSSQKLIDHPNFTQNEPKLFTKNAGDSDDNVCETIHVVDANNNQIFYYRLSFIVPALQIH